MCLALSTPQLASAAVGDVLAAALKQHRRGPGGGTPGGAPAAPQPTSIPFVERLPPLQQVVPAEVWQPDRGGQQGQQQQQQQQQGAPGSNSSGPEVVIAEFSSSSAEPPPPLSLIDDISDAASRQGSKGVGGGVQPNERLGGLPPSGDGSDDKDEEEEDSEQLLAAACAALGLDSEELQRLVDDAAAKAAAAMSVPFVAGRDQPASDVSGSTPGPSIGGSASSTGSSRKPWESAAEPVAGGGGAAGFKGFAASSAKRKTGTAAPASSHAKKPAAPASTPASTPEVEGELPSVDDAGAGGGGVTLPDVEQFILSKSQLKAVTEKHGLDFQELLDGLKERGIPLVD